MVQQGHNAYKQNVGNTVISKEQLLLKLYEGALNFLALAKRGMEENNPRIKGENITKVLNIVTELDCALDMEKGGEMAENLSSLYRHVMFSLVDANLKNNLEAVTDIEYLIREIKDGFAEVLSGASDVCPSPEINGEHKGGMQIAI